jgi:SecD/SecF fusion protein
VNPKTRLIIIGLILAASFYFLWPTFRFYQLDGDRAPLVAKARSRNHTAADSLALARWDSLNGDSYRSAQNGRIKLGLDLRGGIYITMEVDAPTLLLETAQPDAVDDAFEKVIAATRAEAATSEEPVIDIFSRHFDKIARPTGKTLLNYYDVGALGADASDEEIIGKLRRNIDDAIDQAMEVVRRRVDQVGVGEVTLTKQAGDRIVIELPGVSDEEGVRNLLQTTARLEFKLVRNNLSTTKFFARVDKMLAGTLTVADTATRADSGTTPRTGEVTADTTKRGDTTKRADNTDTATDRRTAGDTSGKAVDTAKKPTAGDTAVGDTGDPYAKLPENQRLAAYQKDHPLTWMLSSFVQLDPDGQGQMQPFDYIRPEILPEGDYTYYVPRNRVETVMSILRRSDVRAAMPEDVVFALSADPERSEFTDGRESDNDLFGLYALSRETELTGEVVTDAAPNFDPTSGKPVVNMQMNAEGADMWANITGRNLKKRVAIVLDSAVYSAPVVQSKIPHGNSQITVGGANNAEGVKEANLLSVVLRAGALKAPVRIIEERVVGPSLGQDSIDKGVFSTLVATALVFLFMLMYYRYGGLIACLALLFNILITVALLAAMQATLTLPGIGGLVLTIGMAVDGNILIYERIREELATGKPLARAIQVGYDKAWSAVLDTHITTLISGAILFFFGSGPIQGFAVTLMIGLVATFFTAVFVTRTVFMLNVANGAERLDFGQPRLTDMEPAPAR